jgi:hypothetical protein
MAPVDPFKVTHTKLPQRDMIIEKITKIDHSASNSENIHPIEYKKGFSRTLKWSEKDNLFRCNHEERLFDKIVRGAENYERSIAEV